MSDAIMIPALPCRSNEHSLAAKILADVQQISLSDEDRAALNDELQRAADLEQLIPLPNSD